ncbi:MAG: T9SS type A sorting domain-containing protein [Chitinophagales bacterium]|nr:T9SS type A sorting domain-containing protein [Chitinophagales bacterium]
MKQSIIVYLIFHLHTIAYAQNHDNIWQLSYEPFVPDCGLDFSDGTADTFSVFRDLNFFVTNASICDSSGNLLFYTNGHWIANTNHDSLYNTDHFNPGWATDTFYTDGDGIGCVQCALALPDPGNEQQYYLIHSSFERFYTQKGNWWDNQPYHLSFSIIDMNLDGGLGGISNELKNVYAIEDTLVLGRLTACKHANGRDWWVVTHEYNSNRFYTVLITPDGVSEPFSQYIGEVTKPYFKVGNQKEDNDIGSQAFFSPDGSKYTFVSNNFSVFLFDFDRCSGLLSNFRKDSIGITDINLSSTNGCSFSPNSRYLYVNSYRRIWQYDTYAPDLAASRIEVAVNDEYGAPIQAWFFMNQLAADNKIYIGTFNGTKALHYIDQPDASGLACNVVQHGLQLPTYNVSIPNFPNYDLGALVGSGCDTLSPACVNAYEPNDIKQDAIHLKSDELIQAAIGSAGDVDYYRFSIKSNKNDLKVKLTNLPKDYDLWLLKKNGTLLQQSSHNGLKNEKIIAPDLPEGTYYLVVFSPDNEFDTQHCYSLSYEKTEGSEKEEDEFFFAALEQAYRIYPNPATDWVNIVYDLSSDAVFELFNAYGSKVASVTLYHYFKNRTLNVSNLPAAVYGFRITSNGELMQQGNLAVVR